MSLSHVTYLKHNPNKTGLGNTDLLVLEGALLWEVSKQRLCFSLNPGSICPSISQLGEEPALGWKRYRPITAAAKLAVDVGDVCIIKLTGPLGKALG